MAVLRAENLVRRLEGEVVVTLVNGISLEVSSGEFVAITGPSGSGKSSLLYLLGLLDRPTEGRVYVHGRETSVLSERELAEIRLQNLGFVFQSHFLLPEFSALENVRLPMEKLGRESDKEKNDRAEMLLTQFGLQDHLHKLPRQLSGGQSQRVAIARALANNPPIILADEPTGNLDSHSSSVVREIVIKLAHELGRAVVSVTHDEVFAEAADRRVVLRDGKLEE